MSTLAKLKLENSQLKELAVDPNEHRDNSRPVRGAFFSMVTPQPIESPELVAHSPECLKLLGLGSSDTANEDFVEFFAGNRPPEECYAHCYCGHQFGHFSGQLGDGRAMGLGEVVSEEGRWEMQLKGSGQTPYSRGSDGRAVLRSSIREFLCSEAMFNLGIPTTRAATLITSDTLTIRDVLYNGNAIREKCTVVCRVAPSFLRFGSFQVCQPTDSTTGRSGPSHGLEGMVEELLRYTVKHHYPEIWAKTGVDESKYIEFFEELVDRTARLVALWQSVGFCHGVMNTDNMSILGLTIDYGPFGFMGYFDENYICNYSDRNGRYAYNQQPRMAHWNLMRLAEAMDSAVNKEKLRPALESFADLFHKYYYEKMRAKLGLQTEQEDDKELIGDLMETMQSASTDFTNGFRNLNKLDPGNPKSTDGVVSYMTSQSASLDQQRRACGEETGLRREQLLNVLEQLKVVPQLENMIGLTPDAIQAMLEKMEDREKLNKATEQDLRDKAAETWRLWLERYAKRLSLEKSDRAKRVELMNANNPKFVLRNHLAQSVIEKAEEGDYTLLHRVFEVLKRPYDEQPEVADENFDQTAPDGVEDTAVS